MLKKVTVVIPAILLALSLAGCQNFTNAVTQFSANYQTVVNSVNADIAATAPDVAIACANLQTAGVLVAPYINSGAGPKSAKAAGVLAEVNAGISAYCQAIPTNIQQVIAQVQAAVAAATTAYNQIKAS